MNKPIICLSRIFNKASLTRLLFVVYNFILSTLSIDSKLSLSIASVPSNFFKYRLVYKALSMSQNCPLMD